MMSSKFLMLLRDFVPEYHPAKFGGDWNANKGETGGIMPKILYFTKTAKPKRVKPTKQIYFPCLFITFLKCYS